jgi:hypothetical protein
LPIDPPLGDLPPNAEEVSAMIEQYAIDVDCWHKSALYHQSAAEQLQLYCVDVVPCPYQDRIDQHLALALRFSLWRDWLSALLADAAMIAHEQLMQEFLASQQRSIEALLEQTGAPPEHT